MPESLPQAREDQFLGALLGLAIGDALGKPLRGLDAGAIAGQYGKVTSYLHVEGADEGMPDHGEISDKSEIVLCIVESLTTNNGLIDAANINARLGFLAAGPSCETMSTATVEGIAEAATHDGLVPVGESADTELAVAVRGVPIGLIHSVGALDGDALARDASLVTRLSHGGEVQSSQTLAVARATTEAARTGTVSLRSGNAELDRVLAVVASASMFADAVGAAVGLGGDTDAKGAIAGGLMGARLGASGIPQPLIDGLDARIYLTLAAPWFYRTAVRRAGTVIDLRVIE